MIKYFVNPKKKYVIASLEHTECDVIDFFKRHFRIIYNDIISTDYYSYMNLLMKDSYNVVVKCDPESEFDPEVGKKIAKERLLEKYYRIKDTIIHDALIKYSDDIDSINKYRELAIKNYQNSRPKR